MKLLAAAPPGSNTLQVQVRPLCCPPFRARRGTLDYVSSREGCAAHARVIDALASSQQLLPCPARPQVVRSALSALSETCCPAPDGGGSGGPSSSSQGYYDAVVMDADFPVLDGIEAAARIRHWHAHLAAPPPLLLLVLPASPRDPAVASRIRGLEAAALQAGADVVLHGIDELRYEPVSR